MFNKLTVRLPDEPIYIPDENKWSVTDEFGAKCLIGEVVDRLAAYEDSGLSPEEVVEIKKYLNMWIEICKENNVSIVQFKKWAEAEREGRLVVLPETGIGDLSDGYHTFNELYHHRAILFSVICNEHPDISWKSKLHHDGTMFDGMFIVGINTPEGQATYHYDINPYWDMFRVRELEKAPEWDGHTSEQAIERIAGLTREEAEKALVQSTPSVGKATQAQK